MKLKIIMRRIVDIYTLYVVPTIRFYYGPLNDVGKNNANDKDDDD